MPCPPASGCAKRRSRPSGSLRGGVLRKGEDPDPDVVARLEAALRLAGDLPGTGDILSPEDLVSELGEGWVAEEALAVALYAVLATAPGTGTETETASAEHRRCRGPLPRGDRRRGEPQRGQRFDGVDRGEHPGGVLRRAVPAGGLAFGAGGAGGHPGHGVEAGSRHRHVASPRTCALGVRSSVFVQRGTVLLPSPGPASPRDMPSFASPQRACPFRVAASLRTCPVVHHCEGHVHPPLLCAQDMPSRVPPRATCPSLAAAARDMRIRGGEDWTYCHYVQSSEPPENMSDRQTRRIIGAPDLRCVGS